jgi:hypothetical protein
MIDRLPVTFPYNGKKTKPTVAKKTGTISDKSGTISRFLLHPLVPFTVTKPVTIREMPIAVEPPDAKLVIGKIS